MMERSALSCFPYAIDDMGSYAGRKQLDIGELVVDPYNGAKTANLRSGALQPCSAPLIATNTPPKDDPRLVYLLCKHFTICLTALVTNHLEDLASVGKGIEKDFTALATNHREGLETHG